ncbi:hypothetical protein HK104_001265, partial [Borealophlyctis nickersoniae]
MDDNNNNDNNNNNPNTPLDPATTPRFYFYFTAACYVFLILNVLSALVIGIVKQTVNAIKRARWRRKRARQHPSLHGSDGQPEIRMPLKEAVLSWILLVVFLLGLLVWPYLTIRDYPELPIFDRFWLYWVETLQPQFESLEPWQFILFFVIINREMFILVFLSCIAKWPVEPTQEQVMACVERGSLSRPPPDQVETLSKTLARRREVELTLDRISRSGSMNRSATNLADQNRLSFTASREHLPIASSSPMPWARPSSPTSPTSPTRFRSRSVGVADGPRPRKVSFSDRLLHRSRSHGHVDGGDDTLSEIQASPSTVLVRSASVALKQEAELRAKGIKLPEDNPQLEGLPHPAPYGSTRGRSLSAVSALSNPQSVLLTSPSVTSLNKVTRSPSILLTSPSVTSLNKSVSFVLRNKPTVPQQQQALSSSCESFTSPSFSPVPTPAPTPAPTPSDSQITLSTPSSSPNPDYSIDVSDAQTLVSRSLRANSHLLESPGKRGGDIDGKSPKRGRMSTLADVTSWSTGNGNWRGYEGMRHAVIIACHNSSEVLRTSLPALLRTLPPRSIFIADNGSSEADIEATHKLAEDLTTEYNATHPKYAQISGKGINVGVLREGSKNLAQFSVLNSLAYLGSEIEFVTLLDDDTFLPENWNEDYVISLFDTDPLTHCLAYPIVASSGAHSTFLQFLQNQEYLLAMFIKCAQARISTGFFPSGAVSTWRAHMLLDVLARHDTMFRGDDLQMGLILHCMSGRASFLNPYEVHKGNYRIKVAPYCVGTVVPVCVVHAKDLFPRVLWKFFRSCDCGEPSLFYQRARSWEVARHRFLPKFWSTAVHSQKWRDWNTWFAKLCAADSIVGILNDFAMIAVVIISVLVTHSIISIGVLGLASMAMQQLIFLITHLL